MIDGIREELGCGVLLISHDLQMVMNSDSDVVVLLPHEHDEPPAAAASTPRAARNAGPGRS